MTVRVRLINAHTEEWIGEGDYAGVPRVGDEIMFKPRDWHVYVVEGVRLWPSQEQTPDRELLGLLPDRSLVEARVRYAGFIVPPSDSNPRL